MSGLTLLDLFCGAGGAAMGYHRAGFERIVGVDIKPQPRYPFEFIQADAMTFPLEGYDAIHASPPCQKYGKTKFLAGEHPQLIAAVRARLQAACVPYVIENVPGAPLVDPVLLTAAQFRMRIVRDRLFECSFPVEFVLAPLGERAVKMGRPVRDGAVLQPVGHFSNVPYARTEMGIDWMGQKELAQAIPPAYTEYIGKHLIAAAQGQPRRTTLAATDPPRLASPQTPHPAP